MSNEAPYLFKVIINKKNNNYTNNLMALIKTFLMVSLVFFDSKQFLIYKQTPKNASKYPKLACRTLQTLEALKCEKIKLF